MQHTAINLVTSWASSNRRILYRSHIITLDLFCCHCRRCHIWLVSRFCICACHVIHSSLNKADDCGYRAMAEKINKTWGGSQYWNSGCWHQLGESGAEDSDGEDYFEEEEEEEQQQQQAPPEVATTNTCQRNHQPICAAVFFLRLKKGNTVCQMWRGPVRSALFRGISHKSKSVIYHPICKYGVSWQNSIPRCHRPYAAARIMWVMNYLHHTLYNACDSQA